MKVLTCTEFSQGPEGLQCISDEWVDIVTIGEAADALVISLPYFVTFLLVAFVLKKARTLSQFF